MDAGSCSEWSAPQRALWQRIDAHRPGGPHAADAFVARLTREQRWSEADAHAALREYRRFVFLACSGAQEATPSDAVDAVWHLHLLHSRDYWLHFCPNVLGTELHHEPARGGADAPRHRAQYRATLARYADHFGPPPPQFWPAPGVHAAPPATPPAPRRRGLRAAWRSAVAALATLPALAWAASRPANPLDWNGVDFIGLYLILMLAAVVLGPLWRGWMRRQAETPARHVGALDTTEIAFLVGGPQRAVDSAIAALHARGVLQWDASRERMVRTGSGAELAPPLAAIAAAMSGEHALLHSVGAAAKAIAPVQASLEKRGLWLARDAARRISALSALPAAAVCAFGAIKIGVGIARDRPVAILVVLTVLIGLAALLMYFVRPGRSRAGDREATRLQAQPRAAATGKRPDQLALAVALGGTAVLAGTALAGYHGARAPTSSSSDSSSSSSSGDSNSSSDSSSDSGGGSSCGGCGGGGGGD